MKAMCKFFSISRAAYYAWITRSDKPDKDIERMKLVMDAWEKSRKVYGYRRVTLWIQQKKGISVNHKAVLRLMKKMDIRSVARKRKPYKKMNELDIYHRYKNILNRDFSAEKANQKWVTDITYVRTHQGWAYLSTIKDLFDGFIVAHQLGRRNSVRLVTDTLKKAKRKEKITEKLLLHSDQGYQYTSQAYFLLTKSTRSCHPCHGVAIVGTMLRWRISTGISRKKLCVSSRSQPFNKHRKLLMNILPFTTMKGYK